MTFQWTRRTKELKPKTHFQEKTELRLLQFLANMTPINNSKVRENNIVMWPLKTLVIVGFFKSKETFLEVLKDIIVEQF